METPPDTDENLAGAVKRVLWRLMAVGRNRAELLMVEFQEERARALVVVFLGAGVAVFGTLALFTVTAVIACAFPSHLLLTLGVLAAGYGLGALLFYLKLLRMLSHWETFTGTREQFERDRECLEKKAI
ncbi:MAG TPA: phage holin family protein [Verrucomicrobiae bacterium]|nr:phage holin family protein [Verrucomicrobiae bacterium]